MMKLGVQTDFKELDKMQKDLESEMDKAIYDVADQIFAISQEKVPVKKGTLKKSGNIIRGRGYAYIGYNTPYASTIHDGYPTHDRVVRQHTRKTSQGVVVRVRSHIRQMRQMTGNKYLDNAIKEVLKSLPEEIRNSIDIVRMEREI